MRSAFLFAPRAARFFALFLLFLSLAGKLQAQNLLWARQYVGAPLTLNSIAYSPERGERLAIGAAGALLTSRDAVTWKLGNAGTTTSLNGVAWGSGQYVAVGWGGLIRTSSDGVTWTTRTSGTSNDLMAIAWISPSTTGTGQWMAVGLNGTILTSPDGLTWTSRTSGFENTTPTTGFRAITWANPTNTTIGMAIVVGDKGRIVTSPDGITWTARNPGSGLAGGGISFGGVVWTGTQAMVVGTSGRILTSTNITAWTDYSIMNSDIALSTVFWAPGTGAGYYVASGRSAKAAIYSTNGGVGWPDVVGTLGTDMANLSHGVWDGSHLIALGPNGKLLVSHDGVAPGSVALKAPADSTKNLPLAPSASWTGVTGTGTYHLQVSTNSSFNSGGLVLSDTAVVDTIWTLPSLSEGTEYYWRVRAKNVAGYGSWSTARTFKTLELPPTSVPRAPLLSAPSLFATGVVLSPTFTWTRPTGASTYQIQVSTATSFATMITDDSSLVNTSYSGVVLNGSTDYYWRVRARNSFGNGPWSELGGFTTAVTIPPIPKLITPASFATQVNPPVNLTWETVPAASSYQVQLSLAPDFATLLLQDSTLASASKMTGILKSETSFYWRVLAKNTAGKSEWSTIRRFTTAEATVLNVNAEAESASGLRVEAGRIAFHLARRERVRLRVFDARGQYKQDLVNGFLEPGFHRIRIPVSEHGGQRFLVLQTESHHETLTLEP